MIKNLCMQHKKERDGEGGGSVQLKMASMHSEMPICTSPISQKFSQHHL